MEALTHQ